MASVEAGNGGVDGNVNVEGAQVASAPQGVQTADEPLKQPE
jgi:hypothetical protein